MYELKIDTKNNRPIVVIKSKKFIIPRIYAGGSWQVPILLIPHL